MKSETLMLLTTLFSFLFFSLMKYEMSQPWDIVKIAIVILSSLLFLAWMIVSIISLAMADGVIVKEDQKY